MRDKLTALGAVMLLAGCASSGPIGSQVLTGSIAPSTARLVIYRDSALGFAIQPNYTIDGHAVAGAAPNGFIVCELKPGRREVAVANSAIAVSLVGSKDKLTVDLRPGTTTFLHAQPQPGLTIGVVTLTPVAEAEGRSTTASLHKLDGSCPSA